MNGRLLFGAHLISLFLRPLHTLFLSPCSPFAAQFFYNPISSVARASAQSPNGCVHSRGGSWWWGLPWWCCRRITGPRSATSLLDYDLRIMSAFTQRGRKKNDLTFNPLWHSCDLLKWEPVLWAYFWSDSWRKSVKPMTRERLLVFNIMFCELLCCKILTFRISNSAAVHLLYLDSICKMSLLRKMVSKCIANGLKYT